MEDNYVIKNILHQSEGVRLEFKSDIDKNSIAKDITAFLNTQGGDILIGVDDKKNIVNHSLDENQAEVLKNFLLNEIRPIAPISVNLLKYKGAKIILISVWEGAKKPYHYKNTIYNREGNKNYVSKDERMTGLIQKRKFADFSWERQSLLGAEIEDLDLNEVNKTMKAFSEYSAEKDFKDEEDFLISRGLIQNGNLTNACMVLFGKNPCRFIPQAKIRLTVFSGTSKEDSYLNDKIFEKNIFKNIEAIFEFVDALYGKDIRVEGLYRKERKNYPPLALREGLMNAIIHRDYNSAQGFLNISVYSDRTIISNYGSLPQGITVKDLKTEHNSILRNADIAQMCFYRKYIEMLGSGTLRMIRDCKKEGFKPPVWKDANNILELTFHGVSHHFEGVNEGVNHKIDGVNEGVKTELELLCRFIATNPNKKTNELSKQMGKSISTIERYLKILKENNLVEFVGAPKTGGYHIKKE